MKYNELKLAKARQPRRVGRGISAGQGKTAGRGTKGQNSRSGGGTRPGFEGGQNPLMQRFPKLRGFHSSKKRAEVVHSAQLNNLGQATIDNSTLYKAGLISSPYSRVKLILKGEVTKKVQVNLQSISSGALAAIKKAGGTFTTAPQQARPASSKKSSKAK